MANVEVSEIDLETMSRSLDEAMEFAADVIQCLSRSGDHGTRQGLAVLEAVGELQATLLPTLVQVIDGIREHSVVALQLAGAVSEAEETVVAGVRTTHSRAEATLNTSALRTEVA